MDFLFPQRKWRNAVLDVTAEQAMAETQQTAASVANDACTPSVREGQSERGAAHCPLSTAHDRE